MGSYVAWFIGYSFYFTKGVNYGRTSTNIHLSITATFLQQPLFLADDRPYIDLFKPLHNGQFPLSPRRPFRRDSDKCIW